MKSFNTTSSEAKNSSLNFRQWLYNSLRPGKVTRIGDTGVADPSSSETRFTIGVGRSCFSCWFDSGVRWTWLLLIGLVGVLTSITRQRCWCCLDDFSDRRRFLTKTSVPEEKGLALCLVLNTVFCFNLLMLCRACRLCKSPPNIVPDFLCPTS